MGSWAALRAQHLRASRTSRCSRPSCCATSSLPGGSASSPPARQRAASGSIAFENAITAVSPPSARGDGGARAQVAALLRAAGEPRRAGTCSSSDCSALATAIERGIFGPEWDFHGIGTVGGRDRDDRADRRPPAASCSTAAIRAATPRCSTAHDAGLALMSTPHPSLVPLEMASAGMLTVTNSWETKTAAAMAALSPNLIAVPPGIDGIAAGLAEAVAGVRRLRAPDRRGRRSNGAATGTSPSIPRRWPQSSGCSTNAEADIRRRGAERLVAWLPAARQPSRRGDDDFRKTEARDGGRRAAAGSAGGRQARRDGWPHRRDRHAQPGQPGGSRRRARAGASPRPAPRRPGAAGQPGGRSPASRARDRAAVPRRAVPDPRGHAGGARRRRSCGPRSSTAAACSSAV